MHCWQVESLLEVRDDVELRNLVIVEANYDAILGAELSGDLLAASGHCLERCLGTPVASAAANGERSV